ncbi:MAG: helix-turn-helix domain-containing protein [bacterium]|nr:helix-turn-helix domain-containing protein [bacterium]
MPDPHRMIFREELQDLFSHFSTCFGVKVWLYSAGGRCHHVGGGAVRPPGDYCALIQNGLYGKERCHSLDKAKWQEAIATGSTVRYECHGALLSVVRPIYIENKLLGFFIVGEIRTRKKLPASLMRDWRQRHGNDDIQEALERIPYHDKRRVESMLAIFSALVDHVVSRHMISLSGDALLGKVIEYVQNHVAEPVRIDQVAEAVGRSPSRISHLFRERLQTSFKQAVIEVKLQKAEEYLRTYPSIKVKEVAWRVGYDDAFYFSRLYRKYRGEPPTAYKRRHLEPASSP